MARFYLMGAILFVANTAIGQDDLTPPPPPPPPPPDTAPAPAPEAEQPIPPPPAGYGAQPAPYAQPAAAPTSPAIRPVAPADPSPQRSGFTLEVGLGISLLQSDETDGGVGVGMAPPSLGIGFFVTPDLALGIRATGATFFEDHGETISIFAMQHYGASLQAFVDDDFIIAGGPALSAIGFLDGGDPELGFGVNARAGYALIASRRINIRVLLELLMSVGHDEGAIFAQCLKAEFQLL